ATELDADGKVRAISGEEIAKIRADLSLTDQPAYSRETLQRIQRRSGSEYVVTGSCLPAGGSVRLDVRLQNTSSGETLAAISLNGTEGRLADVAAAAGAAIRARLGLQRLSLPAEAMARGSLPPSREAQQFYAEGLERL